MPKNVHNTGISEKRAKERLRFATHRFRVFIWNEKKGGELYNGFSFASEFSPGGAGIYLDHNVTPGSQVKIAFEAEDAPAYRGQVVWCNRYSYEQKFLGHEALSYRLGVKLQFSTEAERQRYLQYLEDVKNQVLLLKLAA